MELTPLIFFIFLRDKQAVPEGTPYYAGAVGTVQTCTTQGFFSKQNAWKRTAFSEKELRRIILCMHLFLLQMFLPPVQ